MLRSIGAVIAFAALMLHGTPAASQALRPPLAIVAAENFYGGIAQQIGGPDVRVTSVLGTRSGS